MPQLWFFNFIKGFTWVQFEVLLNKTLEGKSMEHHEYSLVNKRNGDRSWLSDLTERLAGKRREANLMQSRAEMSKYADFVCESCSKMFTKDYLINQCQGLCDHCGTAVTATEEIMLANEGKGDKIFECTGCGEGYKRENLQKGFSCDCGSSRFVSQELLQCVIANTYEYIKNKNMRLSDEGGIWHDKGTIYASLTGDLEDGSTWSAVVAASGDFTRNDVIMYEWTPEGGAGTVATVNPDDPLIKFTKNERCSIEWETEDDYVDPSKLSYKDSRGLDINVGSNLEWYEPDGMPVRGTVVKAGKNELTIGITQDRLGRAKAGFVYEAQLNQDQILGMDIQAY